MSGRPPNEFERKLHQAALTDPKNELTAKQSEAIVPDQSTRRNALNYLLGVGLFKLMKDVKGNVSFRAVLKNEINATKDLGGEESLVLNHIKGSANEGIWTKHLKAKTELHQTVIDRCLKTLMQKQLIKVVKSVKHPTRKIYMLAHLDPSVELTGGPWYTDNELDTEFIKLLSNACLRFIQEKSFPKRKSQQSDAQLFPISNSPQYPTAQNIQQFLKQSRITETALSVENVESLLNVLVLDGDVEKVPAYGISMWDSSAIADGEPEDETPTKSKRKHKSVEGDDHRRKRRKVISDSSSEDESPAPKNSKKSKRRADDTESDDHEDTSRSKRRQTKMKKEVYEEHDDEDNSGRKTKSNTKKTPKKRDSSSDNEPQDSWSSSESESQTKPSRSKSRKSPKAMKSSNSPLAGPSAVFDDFDPGLGPAHVYRAIRQERVALGWSQTPCTKCPSFDFCNDRGPVNARECVYYGDWLSTAGLG